EREVFGRVDAVLSAATPISAPPIADDAVSFQGRKTMVRGLLVSLTRLWNFFGGPSTAFPVGLGREGLPLGAQLMGAPFSDARLLGAVHQLERMGAVAARRAPFEG
ncbi:MAG: amidase family protein, partial [Nitrospinota bacterium]